MIIKYLVQKEKKKNLPVFLSPGDLILPDTKEMIKCEICLAVPAIWRSIRYERNLGLFSIAIAVLLAASG